MKYVALLRGINVGGNNNIKMADLKAGKGVEYFASDSENTGFFKQLAMKIGRKIVPY